MHDRLAAAMTSQLSQPAKVLYSLLYALNGNGSGALPIPDVLAMLNYKHIGSLRELLAELRAARLLDSHITGGAQFTWQFTDAPRGPQPRSDDDHAALSRADDDDHAAESRADGPATRPTAAQEAHVTRPTAAQTPPSRGPQPRSDDDHAAHSRADDAVTAVTRPTAAQNGPGIGIGTGKVSKSSQTKIHTLPRTPEQERTYALLTDPAVGLSAPGADAIARKEPFEYVVSQVFSWRHDMARSLAKGVGALFTRIPDPEKFPPHPLTEADRASKLYRTHVADENTQLIQRYPDATPPRPQPEPAPEPDPAAALWTSLCAALHSRPQVRGHLEHSTGVYLRDDTLSVRCLTPGQVDMLRDPRLAKHILPELARLAGRQLCVVYTLAEPEVRHG